jgi:hypothetical protein
VCLDSIRVLLTLFLMKGLQGILWQVAEAGRIQSIRLDLLIGPVLHQGGLSREASSFNSVGC